MKKMVSLLLALFLFIGAFSGCEKAGTDEKTMSSGNTLSSQVASTPVKEQVQNPYALIPIEDDKITTNGILKTFQDFGLNFQFPAQWNSLKQQGEDGASYLFREPNFGEKCQFIVTVTGAEYKYDRTKDEYLEYLSETYEDVKISSFEKEKLAGYDATKIAATYVGDNTRFVRIVYDNVVVGARLYDFISCYPEAEKETYDDVFESILKSIIIE